MNLKRFDIASLIFPALHRRQQTGDRFLGLPRIQIQLSDRPRLLSFGTVNIH